MDADIKWLDEPETFRVNQLPAHSDHYYYGNYDEWRHNNSRFAQNLDGQWQFNFAENPREREEDFYKTDYDSSSFGTIEVPSEIELNNYAQNNYINTLIPWEGKIYRRPAYALSPDDAQEGSFSDGDDNTVGEYLKHFDLEPSLRESRSASGLMVSNVPCMSGLMVTLLVTLKTVLPLLNLT